MNSIIQFHGSICSSTSSTYFDATSVRPEFAVYPPFNSCFVSIDGSSLGDAISELDSNKHIHLPQDANEGLSQPIDALAQNMTLMLSSITTAETAVKPAIVLISGMILYYYLFCFIVIWWWISSSRQQRRDHHQFACCWNATTRGDSSRDE